jgi:hypothetical protein
VLAPRVLIMTTSSRRAGLYLRVSSDRQSAENQFTEVRQLAVSRGFEPVVYEEVERAAKARPVLDRLLADVRAGRVQAVAVWALDRLHRSMTGAIKTVLELDRLGVPVLSVREGWLDTSGPVRPLLVAISDGLPSKRGPGSSSASTRVWSARVGRARPSGAPAPRSCSYGPLRSSWRVARQ